jgi:phosphatidate cytidylyltransferase
MMQCVLYLTRYSLPDYLGMAILMILIAAEAFIWGKRNQRKRWVRASLLFSGNAFLYIAAVSMLYLYRPEFHSLFIPFDSPLYAHLGVIIVVASVFFCDTFAYFIGSLWGKHHFSSISPNKTIEGSIAGLIAATVVSSVGWWFLAAPEFHPLLGVVMGLLIGIFAQVGDLLVSLIKRYFKVKDASNILPGHGGILDRFDSVFFTMPVISLFTFIVTKFAG